MNPFISLAITVLSGLVKRAVNVIWDDVWDKLFELVKQAENDWNSKEGPKKREWVVKRTLEWMDGTLKPNKIERFILRFAVGALIDMLIGSINDGTGHDWVGKAKEIEEKLAEYIPVIE